MKHYTFNVTCSFTMQFTFDAKGVERDPDGDYDDYEPTEAAIVQLQDELQEYLSQLRISGHGGQRFSLKADTISS
jgi:hypothetical protein